MSREVRVKIYNIVWEKPDTTDYKWYCESCDECLNEQGNFSYCCGIWECTNCGHHNVINEDLIVDDEDLPTKEEDNFYIESKDELEFKIRCYLYDIYGRRPISFKYGIAEYCDDL